MTVYSICMSFFFIKKSYFINCNWDTDPNKSDDFLLDPFCICNKYAMFWFVFSVKNYTNKILFKLKKI